MYQDFALLYDELMEEFLYKNYENNLLALCPPQGKILEIGCGTGRMTSFFFQQGAEVHALDPSTEMLSFAKRKVPKANFILGHLEEMDLGVFEKVYACIDILNYYLNEAKLREFLMAVKRHCKESFFFDLRHPKAMKEELSGRTHYYESSLGDLVWNNEEVKENLLWQELIFYWKEEDCYKKGFEEMYQRIWAMEEIETLLSELGFNLLHKKEEPDRFYYHYRV